MSRRIVLPCVLVPSVPPTWFRSAGLTAKQLAETLNATARGLKYSCATRAEFTERFSIAVRAMCTPLGV